MLKTDLTNRRRRQQNPENLGHDTKQRHNKNEQTKPNQKQKKTEAKRHTGN